MNVCRYRAFTWLLPLALTVCASPPPAPPAPAVLTLTLQAGSDQNPTKGGKPAPVAVRVVQLAGSTSFEQAEPLALIDHEKDVLGADDLASEEIILSPGQTQTLTRALKPGAQSLGVLVLFRDIYGAQWRALAPLAATGPTKLTLHTARASVTLVSAN